ncbi:RagB/SusD family nutrient uptake outer membrane protein [Gangjinia marincola]|uniref:RagB/SusD family nutrient uptake outer membrane protein n=1 Tax=Gangjinia marincola TaxID=578463 RepID=A0ABN1MJZ4_9FLAO
MKKCYYILVLIFAIGCEDFLDKEPVDAVSFNEQLGSYAGMQEVMNGTYIQLEAVIREREFYTYADLLGGNITFAPVEEERPVNVENNVENIYTFNDREEDSDLASVYQSFYEVINSANLMLDYVDNLTDASTAQKDQIKAETLAIRAFTHEQLLRLYGQHYLFTADASHLGIVYNTEPQEPGVDFSARKTVAESYALIIADYQQALDLITSESVLPLGPNYSYFSQESITALLIRAYLNAANWQRAADLAEEFIAETSIPLMITANYVAEWEQPNAPVSEVILELSLPTDNGGDVSGSLEGTFGYTPVEWGRFVASQDLRSLYDPLDVRSDLFIAEDIITTINQENIPVTYYWTKKFQDNPGTIIMRLSEVYLIAAEAQARLGNDNVAQNYLYTIVQRANPSVTPVTATGQDLLDAILLERRKELAFEGHYFYDLARFEKDVIRDTFGGDCIAQQCNLLYPNTRFVLPIPERNLNLNENLVQNDGY